MNVNRTEIIKFRVTENEKNEIKKRAKKAKLSVSDFSRMMLMNGDINLIEVNDLVQLKKIGTNINQITKALHFTSHFKYDEMKNNLDLLLNEIEQIKKNTISFDSGKFEK